MRVTLSSRAGARASILSSRARARTSTLGACTAFLIACGDPLPEWRLPEGTCFSAACREGNCTDGKLNGGETDVDCGGRCEQACGTHAKCVSNADCASLQCDEETKVCVAPPVAHFALSATSGTPGLTVTATSEAREGSAPIAAVSYDWDDGQGFEPTTNHTFTTGGHYFVRQRVVDERGAAAVESLSVDINDEFRQVRFSQEDHSPSVRLSPDRLSVEQLGTAEGGVRSDEAILPGSRVYYFEVERLIKEIGAWGFGVATADESLTQEVGHQRGSLGVLTLGGLFNGGDGLLMGCTRPGSFPVETRVFGFVVDYRGAQPKVHLVIDQEGTPTVNNTCTMPVTDPLYIIYAGTRHRVGYQARINTGSDTVNHPFRFSQSQLLLALGNAMQSIPASDFVYGWGGTRARPLDNAPSLSAPADQSMDLGGSLDLTASASDLQDGDLSSHIRWLDISSQHHAPVEHLGAVFRFTPTVLGIHPLSVSVRDGAGLVTTKVVRIQVDGDLPVPERVQLEPDAYGGKGVFLSNENLSARFDGLGKYGVRANQGIQPGRNSFYYFEAQREKPAGNMGVGLIIGEGDLNPYHFEDVPWSCSINLSGNTWRNLISLSRWDREDWYDSYGFAVDYRGEHPIVHILIGHGSTAELQSSLTLDDVYLPIYPMVYGNPQERGDDPDVTVNFGATPFAFDPRPLVPGGTDRKADGGFALQRGWGVHARD